MTIVDVSPWLPTEPERAAPLAGDREVDVAIVGAGYTGLSTALALHGCSGPSKRSPG